MDAGARAASEATRRGARTVGGGFGRRAALASLAVLLALAVACSGDDDGRDTGRGSGPPSEPGPTATPSCENTCTDYPSYWVATCPAGERCIEFRNSCEYEVALSYQIGCDENGQPGAPTCNCTTGPTLAKSQSAFWQIVDVDDSSSCDPKISPACLTSGLAVLVNASSVGTSCAVGTRVEFTAGNAADPDGRFDTYNIDVEKDWYSLPVLFKPAACSQDAGAPLDCRPLYCNEPQCPDAFDTSTTGGCSDNRSPAAGCQTSFGDFGTASGFLVEYCPANCPPSPSPCPSCQTATMCSDGSP